MVANVLTLIAFEESPSSGVESSEDLLDEYWLLTAGAPGLPMEVLAPTVGLAVVSEKKRILKECI